MTNSNDPWHNLINAANSLNSDPSANNESAFRDALQASLRQEQQRTRDQYGTDALSIFHGEWQASDNRGVFSLKLGSQHDETLTTDIDLGQGQIATIFVDLSRVDAKLIIHGQVVLAPTNGNVLPLTDSEVSLYHPDGSTAHTELDENGEFSFPLPSVGSFGLEILLLNGDVLQLDDITVEM